MDDFILARHTAELRVAKDELFAAFNMKDLEDLKWFLGIRIIRDRPNKKLYLCHDRYIKKLVETFLPDYTENNKHTVPILTSREIYPNEGQASESAIWTMQRVVGSLLHAQVYTRPDIAVYVNLLSRHCLNPSAAHIEAAYDILRYLYNTRYRSIQYGGSGVY